ncbi:MAG TPA: acyl-CoA dehydrogenase family protein [Jatrophihabitantaceae bacterium]
MTELDDFAASIRAYCRKRLPEPTLARPGRIRDADSAREQWHQVTTELGLGALLIPDAFGGASASLVEAGRAAEALGAELAAVPFLSAGVLAPALLTSLVADDADSPAADLLAGLASGHRIVAVAWLGDHPTYHYVIDADIADVIVVVHGDRIAVAGDPVVTPRVSFDLTRGFADVVVGDAPGTVLASGDAARTAVRRMLAGGRLAVAAECAGGARAALDHAVDYAKQRVQFGREIGSFQAIKHMLADCYVAAESALSTARQAIAAHVDGAPDADELLALAAFYCPDLFADVAAANIQVHGGMGFTVECGAHLYRRRAESDRHIFNEPAQLRAEYLHLVAGSTS